MPGGNPSLKLTITIAPEIHAQILKAAARRGVSVSVWITDAARLALKGRDGLAAAPGFLASPATPDPSPTLRLRESWSVSIGRVSRL